MNARAASIDPRDRGARGMRLARLRGEDDGAAMVEFALVLPLLLLLVTGMLQFGLVFNRYITLTDAVRSGARQLSLGRGLADPCDVAITQTVNSALNVNLQANQVTATLVSPDTCGTGTYPNRTGGNMVEGDQATITATIPYTLKIFGIPVYSGNLTASASNAIE
jgi:Flp pilus assembly protein TadG